MGCRAGRTDKVLYASQGDWSASQIKDKNDQELLRLLKIMERLQVLILNHRMGISPGRPPCSWRFHFLSNSLLVGVPNPNVGCKSVIIHEANAEMNELASR